MFLKCDCCIVSDHSLSDHFVFLQQLCTIPETANSDEMQEFLALHTDASTAFEKKPFVMSRIDKVTTVLGYEIKTVHDNVT